MKRIDSQRADGGGKSGNRGLDPLAKELDGYVDAGMKSEALRLARNILKQIPPSAEAFSSALSAILTLVERLDPWALMIKTAYPRLTGVGQRSSRYLVLHFHCHNHDYQTAVGFLLARFGNRCNLHELGLAMQIRLALNQLDEAALLTKKCMRGVARADPAARAILLHGLTDYFTRVREWDRATEIWEQLQDDDLLAESALIGLVEINAARALSAIQSGLEALAIRRKNFDPDTEIVIPGNDKLRWDKTEKKLQHHRKWIEKVLPKERQKAFGFKVQ